jgi:type I restriction enzyme, S subunit
MVLPPERIRACFEQYAASLFAKAESASRESVTLVALRDTLLPKLISGELRVHNPDTVTERSTP